MTKDVIALTERMPDAWSVLAGLLAGGPDLHIRSAAEGAVVQLCDAEGRPLVSIEAPLQLHVPGEARRLLGATGVDGTDSIRGIVSSVEPTAWPWLGLVAGVLAALLGVATVLLAGACALTGPATVPAAQGAPYPGEGEQGGDVGGGGFGLEPVPGPGGGVRLAGEHGQPVAAAVPVVAGAQQQGTGGLSAALDQRGARGA